ncbi:GNAT family N-acetyltransferase [Levilactobacillus sp. HBUAS70063]|uniref:GNAT family N-acetyltransferase n=1 Tax=Levilactobacillus sp. HBUAS70063 TaxID=3109359 RepID=UPI003132FED3
MHTLADNIQLKAPQLTDAPALFACIAADRDYLVQWLPWVATTRAVADEAAFLRYCQTRIAAHQLWLAVIWVAGQPAGMIDLHEFQDDHAAVGYWLSREHRGQGIMTRCLATVEVIGFHDLGLHEIDLLADPANHASRAVAERRGFQRAGVLREHLPLAQGGYHDAVIYSKLSQEFTD